MNKSAEIPWIIPAPNNFSHSVNREDSSNQSSSIIKLVLRVNPHFQPLCQSKLWSPLTPWRLLVLHSDRNCFKIKSKNKYQRLANIELSRTKTMANWGEANRHLELVAIISIKLCIWMDAHVLDSWIKDQAHNSTPFSHTIPLLSQLWNRKVMKVVSKNLLSFFLISCPYSV